MAEAGIARQTLLLPFVVWLFDNSISSEISYETFSSAFVVRTERDRGGTPVRLHLAGGGWGHGVGLCQIGAAAMAARGRTAEQILAHYFPGATVTRRY